MWKQISKNKQDHKRLFDRLSYRHEKKKTIVALAQKLSTIGIPLKRKQMLSETRKSHNSSCPAIIPKREPRS